MALSAVSRTGSSGPGIYRLYATRPCKKLHRPDRLPAELGKVQVLRPEMDGAAFYVLGQGGVAHKPLQLGAGVLEQAGPLQGLLPARRLCGLARLSAASFSPLNRLRQLRRKPARSGRLFCGSSKATKNTFSPGAEAARRLALRPQSVSAATCPGTSPQGLRRQQEERASPRCSPRADTAAGFMKTTCSPSVPMTASSADSKSAAVFL